MNAQLATLSHPVRRSTLPLLLALVVAGCSSPIVGTWKTDEQPPENPVFFVAALDFRDDGTFHVSARDEERNLFLRGQYDFNGFRLRLRPDNATERTYDAMIWWGRELRLSTDGRRQIFRRQ